MILTTDTNGHMMAFSRLEQMLLTGGAAGRLLLAAGLGCAIGIDREYHHRPSGLRTNVLICFGSAMFTFLSAIIAGDGGNRAQIASNIVQGIGFLGAGLILHNRSRINGLTSAATVWVVASIGMACGAGLYAAAIVGAGIVIAALEVVGFLERGASLKEYSLVYEARGPDRTKILESILAAMDEEKERLTGVENDTIGAMERVSFPLTATKKQHQRLRVRLQADRAIDAVLVFHDPEED